MAVGVGEVGNQSFAQPEGLRPNAYDLSASDIEISDGDDDVGSSDNYHPDSEDGESAPLPPALLLLSKVCGPRRLRLWL